MRHTLEIFCLALLLVVLSTDHSSAAVRSRRVASGLSQPLFATAAPNDPSRLFILEKTGQIKIFDRESEMILGTPFLDLGSKISTEGQRGLYGMAFHPDFASNGQFFLNYIDTNGNTQISRFEVSGDANVANPASETFVLGFEQPEDWHAGGWIGFSPVDNYLYITSGDGAGRDDPFSQGQDTDTLLGTILRLDVNGDDFPSDPAKNYAIPASNPFVGGGGAAENWAYGLRSPWRGSFDRETGDLYVADVGQDTREEVNYQRAGAAGGANYGWPLREGTIETPTGDVGGPRPADNVDPIYDYDHERENVQGHGAAVTGGYVYRGPDPSLQGKYFFADFIRGEVWSFDVDRDTETLVSGSLTDWTNLLAPDTGSYAFTPSFGEDSDGNLYVIGIGGDVFMLEAIPAVAANGAFLEALYLDVLGREGESEGVAYWGSELTANNLTFQDVASKFWLSEERLTGIVSTFYDSYLGRSADSSGLEYWTNQVANGESHTNVITAFLSSPEFSDSHMSDGSFVDALYDLVLGRAPDEAGRMYYLAALAGGLTREETAAEFVNSYERRVAAIDSLYVELLNRPADEAAMTSYLTQLGGGLISLTDIANDILTTDEYIYAANRVIGDFDTYIAGLPFGSSTPPPAVAAPEPSTALLVLVGTAIVAMRRRRR